MNKHPNLIYLASPYSHTDEYIQHQRAKEISQIAGQLIGEGVHVYCPIAETVMIAKHGELNTTDWEFWKAKDCNQLSRCDELWIAQMDGYQESIGIKGEVKYALENNIPVWFLDPVEFCLYQTDSEKELLDIFNCHNIKELES